MGANGDLFKYTWKFESYPENGKSSPSFSVSSNDLIGDKWQLVFDPKANDESNIEVGLKLVSSKISPIQVYGELSLLNNANGKISSSRIDYYKDWKLSDVTPIFSFERSQVEEAFSANGCLNFELEIRYDIYVGPSNKYEYYDALKQCLIDCQTLNGFSDNSH